MSRISHATGSQRATSHFIADKNASNARQVDRRAVACPDCGAAIGQRCVTPTGRPTLHVSRKRLTTRLHNERLQQWDLLVEVNKVTFKERRAMLQGYSGSMIDLAVELDIAYHSLRNWFHTQQPPATDAGVRFAAWVLAQRAVSA